MATVIYVPADAAARSVGADAVVDALRAAARTRGLDIDIRRNGSRGLLWAEPLLEVETPHGRHGYGPVSAADVDGLLDAGLLRGGEHRLSLGLVDEHPYLKAQQRLTFRRVGLIEPTDLAQYLANRGYTGLRRALAMTPQAIVQEVIDSGLRGRGGAAFPTGVKWKTVLEAAAAQKYVTCNADEGDSGTFADRLLMEGDPFALIEGMTIAALAVCATQGFIYLRIEYPHARAVLQEAIRIANENGYLGADVCGSGRRFELHLRMGAGAYICGEETSMLQSLEGRRGEVRVRPPLPAIKGLFGQPTVVNNVISLATVPVILERGAQHYVGFGSGRSRGTVPIQLAGNLKRTGLVELAFGITLRELLQDVAQGSASGRPIRAVQIGGPLGAYIPASQFDVVIDYEALAALGGLLGHGGIVAFDDSVDMAAMARYAMEFCALESCGKCTPCRIGSTRGVELIDRIVAGERRDHHLQLLDELCGVMTHASLCGLGSMTPLPVQSALTHFRDDFLKTPRAQAGG